MYTVLSLGGLVGIRGHFAAALGDVGVYWGGLWVGFINPAFSK